MRGCGRAAVRHQRRRHRPPPHQRARGGVRHGGPLGHDLARILRVHRGAGRPHHRGSQGGVPPRWALPQQAQGPVTKPGNLEAMASRVAKKIYADKEKWSNNKFKEHCSDVISLMSNIIRKEVVDKGFPARVDPFAVHVVASVVGELARTQDLGDCDWPLSGFGRCEFEAKMLADLLPKAIPPAVALAAHNEGLVRRTGRGSRICIN
mmetsp:Transcript_149/g.378  ORF Transcript_149/g.378 Transcript_149/m.378 type:complete len:207 (-) Transcript_149:143-763(-)